MSKKSRRRNKKILGALALLGTGLAMANRRNRNNMINSADANDGFVDTEFKEQVVSTPKVVTTKNTIMDSMPKRPKLNEKSIRVKDGKVYTIQDAKKGIKPKMSGIDTPGIYVRDDGRITAGGKQYLNKAHYASRNEKPAMLGTNYYKAPAPVSEFKTSEFDYFSKGGRVKKRTGAAKRGFGRAFKGGKR